MERRGRDRSVGSREVGIDTVHLHIRHCCHHTTTKGGVYSTLSTTMQGQHREMLTTNKPPYDHPIYTFTHL